MLRMISRILGLTALAAVMLSPTVVAVDEEFGGDYYNRIKIDRYLDIEIWTNHSDNEFHEGDNFVLNFRTNQDAFVAIYSVDSKGRVNMLFPMSPDDDNYVRGGATYRIPDGADDFDLVVTGPEGVENIQAIASRERFPIPDWYPASGLICDWEDRLEFMDYINAEHFVKYGGQRFAFDRSAIYIEEWEPHYYRPIYHPVYPSWSVCGNVYIDYPYGGTVYIDGIYWGVIPLYIPRIYIGWHTFTIYDYYGYCWEYPVHVTRYNTVILDRTVIVTSPTVVSKYKDVRLVGYRNPVAHGYPTFKTKNIVTAKPPAGAVKTIETKDVPLAKKFVRGSSNVIKTDRGYETAGGTIKATGKGKGPGSGGATYRSGQTRSPSGQVSKRGSTPSQLKSPSGSSKSDPGTGSSKVDRGSKPSKSSSGYYLKKSGSSSKPKSDKGTTKSTVKPKPESSDSNRNAPEPKSSTKKSPPPKKSPEKSTKTKDSKDTGKSRRGK